MGKVIHKVNQQPYRMALSEQCHVAESAFGSKHDVKSYCDAWFNNAGNLDDVNGCSVWFFVLVSCV